MAASDQQHLLHVLNERDISLGPGDVASVFEAAQTQEQTRLWIREYLTPATLLTKDELEFYERSGSLSGDRKVRESDAGGPFSSDTDVETAIRSLEASTAAIEEQCRILESQKLALQQLRVRHTRVNSIPAGLDGQQRSFERQRAQVDFGIDELSQSLVERVKLAARQADSWNGNIASNADRLFDKDDRLLDGLQKLLPVLFRSSTHINADVDVEKLCTTLHSLLVQEIRARLDAAYVDSLAQFRRQTNGHLDVDLTSQQEKQRQTLRAELGELSGEIDGLASIVVDHRYRNPIKDTQAAAQADARAQRTSWGEYLINALEYMTARLDKVNDHVQHIHAHRAALRAISGSLDEVNAMQPPNVGAAGVASGQRSNSKGLKPLRLVQANFSELQDPAVQLLRQLDVRTSEINDPARLEETLESALHERIEKLRHLSSSTENSITNSVAKSLSDTDMEIRSLLGAVHASSTSRTIQLVDLGIADALQNLEIETQQLSEGMRNLDPDQITRSIQAKQRTIARSTE